VQAIILLKQLNPYRLLIKQTSKLNFILQNVFFSLNQ
jgi:hypothetical protein